MLGKIICGLIAFITIFAYLTADYPNDDDDDFFM